LIEIAREGGAVAFTARLRRSCAHPGILLVETMTV